MGIYDLISGWSEATPYFGRRDGAVKQEANLGGPREARVGHTYLVDDTNNATGIYGGLRKGDLSIEAGINPLGRRHSRNISDIFDIHQDISTDMMYLAALKHFDLGSFQPHVLGGLANVNFKNYEYGSNENGPNQRHYNSGSSINPMLGVGFTWSPEMLRPLSIRGDYFKIPNVARSLWTRSSDVDGGFLGLQYQF